MKFFTSVGNFVIVVVMGYGLWVMFAARVVKFWCCRRPVLDPRDLQSLDLGMDDDDVRTLRWVASYIKATRKVTPNTCLTEQQSNRSPDFESLQLVGR